MYGPCPARIGDCTLPSASPRNYMWLIGWLSGTARERHPNVALEPQLNVCDQWSVWRLPGVDGLESSGQSSVCNSRSRISLATLGGMEARELYKPGAESDDPACIDAVGVSTEPVEVLEAAMARCSRPEGGAPLCENVCSSCSAAWLGIMRSSRVSWEGIQM